MVHVKWHRKESSKNIITVARSAHPSNIERAVIHNMFKKAVEVCSGKAERHESTSLAAVIANENGYSLRKHRCRRTRNESKNYT